MVTTHCSKGQGTIQSVEYPAQYMPLQCTIAVHSRAYLVHYWGITDMSCLWKKADYRISRGSGLPYTLYNVPLYRVQYRVDKSGGNKIRSFNFFVFFLKFCPVFGSCFSSACANLIGPQHFRFDYLVAMYLVL